MNEQNPWKTIQSCIVYQNPWLKIREDQVIRPDGSPGIYAVVDKDIATGVVALDDNSKIYLVGQYRYPTKRYSWEIIEGGCDQGETPLQAAQRELKEEAGLTATEWTMLSSDIQLSNCITSEIGRLFLARQLHAGENNPEPTEVLQVKKVPLELAMQMIFNGEITDAMSIIGLTLTYKLLAGS